MSSCRDGHLLAGMVLLVLGCSVRTETPRAESGSWVLADDLQAVLTQPEEVMHEPRTPLVLDDGSKVMDCSQYLALRRSSGLLSEQISTKLAASEYLVCDVLAAAPNAHVPRNRPPLDRAQQLAARLDLRSFRSSLRPMLGDHDSTLQHVSGQLQASGNVVTLRMPGGVVTLQVIVEADLNEDGDADWLVWLLDEATDSNYRDYRSLLVSDPSSRGPLRAADFWPEHR